MLSDDEAHGDEEVVLHLARLHSAVGPQIELPEVVRDLGDQAQEAQVDLTADSQVPGQLVLVQDVLEILELRTLPGRSRTV